MIKKAVIPIAGKGTRLMPVTSVLPKALFPIIDGVGRVKTVIHIILEELKKAKIDDVAVVVSPGQAGPVKQYLSAVRSDGNPLFPSNVCYIEQSLPRGFGDATLCARNYVGKDTFVLLLGDHLRISEGGGESCVNQVLKAYESVGGAAMVGMYVVPELELGRVGVAAGQPLKRRIYHCTDLIEKPDRLTASQRLRTPGLQDGFYLAHCGIYIFTPDIFTCLCEEYNKKTRATKEIELSSAQIMLLNKYPNSYYLYQIAGTAFDIGTPEGYFKTLQAFAIAEVKGNDKAQKAIQQ
jgi:UTP--glucose-1-phosphate uridylyltransferase